MKINVNIPMNAKRTRVLASFMAFLIFALTFQQAFVGWDIGLRVRAEAGDGNIRATSTNKTSSMKSNIQTRANTAAGGTSPYTYSGEYTDKNKVTLFDYVSDYELAGTYNNCSQTEEGYVDAYNAFNNAISHSSNSITYQASDNMTIEFQAQYRPSSKRPTEVKVNYWDDNSHGSDFQTMTYFSQSRNDDGTYNYIYRYTVNNSNFPHRNTRKSR